MVALFNRADHYIFDLWFLSFFFFYFPCLISAVGDWMSTILPHMVWPYSANLECMSEMCGMRLAENTGRKKKHLAPSHNLSGCIFTAESCIDNRKKNLLINYASSTGPHNMEEVLLLNKFFSDCRYVP